MRDLWHSVLGVMDRWHQGKLFIEHAVAIDHDAIHVIAGAVIWLAAGALLRRSVARWSPWLVVLAFNIWNEAVDLSLEQWPDRGWQYGESAKDLMLTLAVPTLMMLAMRFRPSLFR